MQTLKELILRNRSYRRFRQEEKIETSTLRGLVDLARLSASAANLQPLKYILSNEPGLNARIFEHLAWAGYLSDWPGPEEGERPSAYITIVGDTRIHHSFGCDHGIAAQSILLGAAERSLGGCMIGSIKREGLSTTLNIPDFFKILLVIALGKPSEQVVIEETDEQHGIKYWRDDKGIHHVPKRSLDELVL
jgi:nitroreductase